MAEYGEGGADGGAADRASTGEPDAAGPDVGEPDGGAPRGDGESRRGDLDAARGGEEVGPLRVVAAAVVVVAVAIVVVAIVGDVGEIEGHDTIDPGVGLPPHGLAAVDVPATAAGGVCCLPSRVRGADDAQLRILRGGEAAVWRGDSLVRG